MTLRKLCGNKMLLLSLVLVIIWLFLALISPWIVPQDPFAVHMEERLQAGSMIHWMGTDSLGRDEFSRILYGFSPECRRAAQRGGHGGRPQTRWRGRSRP